MMRKATRSDTAATKAFLRPHAEPSMFLRGNLAAYDVNLRRAERAASDAARLAEARRDGAARAILFAASHHAWGVYERIGFQRVGDDRIRLFSELQRVRP